MSALHPVGKVHEFIHLKPRILEVGGLSIGVYRFKDRFYAYENECPHEGGPACEGLVLGNVECEILDDFKTRESISAERFNITCPWHGVEYDLETGRCRSNSRLRLRALEVVVRGEEVFVTL